MLKKKDLIIVLGHSRPKRAIFGKPPLHAATVSCLVIAAVGIIWPIPRILREKFKIKAVY